MKRKQLLLLLLVMLVLGAGIFLITDNFQKRLERMATEEKGDFLKNALQFNIIQDLPANISGNSVRIEKTIKK